MDKAKKKFRTMLTALIIASAVVFASVGAILAALSQTVSTNFAVNYTASDVAATVKANYIIATEAPTVMHTQGGEDSLVFLPNQEGGGTLAPDGDIILEANKPYVVFEYMFTNNSSSVDAVVELATLNVTKENIVISYAYGYSRIDDVTTMATTDAYEKMAIVGSGKESGNFETLYVYVKIEIENLSNNAMFSGEIGFDISRIESYSKLSFENVSSATNKNLFGTMLVPTNTTYSSIARPTFADGKNYGWFVNSVADENYVHRTYTVSANNTLYAGETPDYVIETTAEGSSVTNYSDNNLEVTAPANSTYSFGGAVYTFAENDKLLLQEGQEVTISEAVAANASAGNVVEVTAINVSEVTDELDLENYNYYAAYGMYPQTVVSDDELTILGNQFNITNGVLTVNPDVYTTDVNGEEVKLDEYIYNGKRYAKLESVQACNTGDSFSTGVEISNDIVCYFVVEPILCEVMESKGNGKYVVMSKAIIGSKAFRVYGEDENNNNYDNSWKNSNLRSYLNSEFITESGLNDLAKEINIINEDPFNTSNYDENTIDKIWLASAREIITWTGSTYEDFTSNNYLEDDNAELRKAKPTDFGIATFCSYYKNYDSGYYFLRSPGDSVYFVCGVYEDGYVSASDSYRSEEYGFRPCFMVNI